MTRAHVIGWRLLREAALWLGAVIGLVCVVITIAGLGFGVKALVFRSGSMSPAISTGALAFAHPVAAADLQVGDVVSVTVKGKRVTHRIAHLVPHGDSATLILKGDANPADDAAAHVVRRADRVFLDVPRLGYVVSWLGSPGGLFVLGLMAGALLLVVFRPGPGTGGRRHRGAGGARGAPVGVILLALALAAPASLTLNRVVPTGAWLTDSASAAAGTWSADYLRPVVIACNGAGLLKRPTISWTAPAGPTPTGGYQVTYVGTGSGSSSGSVDVTGTSWGFPSSLVSIGATYTITVRTRRNNWISASSNAVTVTVTSVVLNALTTCGT